jgi:hypothetical protein
MKIVDRWKDLVHTHFVTDAVRLTAERTRDIERALGEVLRSNGIVFGTHFAHARQEPGIRIVLECQPDQRMLERIQQELARIVAPVPTKPPTVTAVNVDSP